MTTYIDVNADNNRRSMRQSDNVSGRRQHRFSDDADIPAGNRYEPFAPSQNGRHVSAAAQQQRAGQRQFGAPTSRSPSPTRRGSNHQMRARSLSQHELGRQQQNGNVYPPQHIAPPPLKAYQPFGARITTLPAGDIDEPPPHAVELPRKQRAGRRHHHGRRKRGNQHRNSNNTTNLVIPATTSAIHYPVVEVESRGGYEYPRTPSPPPATVLMTPNTPNPVYTTTSTYFSTPPQPVPVTTVAAASAYNVQHQPSYYGPKSSSYRKDDDKLRTTIGEPAPPSRHFGANSRFIHTIKKLPLGWTKHSIVTTGTEPDTGVITTVKQNIITNEDRHRKKYLRNERQKPVGVYEEYPRYKWYCRPRPANTSAYAWMLVAAGLFNLACGFFMIILAYNAQGDSGTILLWKILGPIGMALGLIFLLIGLYLLYYYYKYDRKNKEARLAREEAAAVNNPYYYQQQTPRGGTAAPSYVASVPAPYSTYAGEAGAAPHHHHYEHLRSVPPTVIAGDLHAQPMLKSAMVVPSRSNLNNNGVVDSYYQPSIGNQQAVVVNSNGVAVGNGRMQPAVRTSSVRYREPPAVLEYSQQQQPAMPVYAQPAMRQRG